MTKPQTAFLEAIRRAGGQVALAKELGVPQSTISFWLHGAKKGVSAEKVTDVERITLVPRHELRPDLFPPPDSTPENTEPTADVEPGKGHFSRFKHLRRAHFASAEEVNAHIRALRDEWDRR